MTGIEGIPDQDPLRSQLERDLNGSEWLQKFRMISRILQDLKTQLPLTQQCELRWDTTEDALVIHCPTSTLQIALQQKSSAIATLAEGATAVILRHKFQPDVIIAPN